MRGDSDLNYAFATAQEAVKAMKIADKRWYEDHLEDMGQQVLTHDGKIITEPREVYTPKGTVTPVVIIEDGIEEVGAKKPTHFVVFNEDNEYMVSNEDPEWVCVV